MKYYSPPFLLKEIKIEVTYKCPLSCIHCSSDASSTNTLKVSKEKCFEIISDAIDMGVETIAFSGGEPLIWEGIEESIKMALNGSLDVSVYTSGNIENFSSKLNIIRNYGTPIFIFSIFGVLPSTHDSVTRVKGSYESTIEAAELSKNMGFRTEFHFVPFSRNYDELTGIAMLAKKMNIERVSILRFVPQGRGALMKRHVLNRGQNLQLKKMILDIRASGLQIRTGSPYNFLFLNDQPACFAAKDRLIIAPDLRIYPCDAFKQIKAEEIVHTLEFSSLNNHSLNSCWEKSPYLNAIRHYLMTDFEEPCSSCEMLDLCLSGCLAQKVIENGTLEKSPDPLCILGKAGGQND